MRERGLGSRRACTCRERLRGLEGFARTCSLHGLLSAYYALIGLYI